MRFSRYLVLLSMVACATQQYNYAPVNEVAFDQSEYEYSRSIASTVNGSMSYPSDVTYDMKNVKGQSYITFLKKKLKPALDKFSDKKNGGAGGFQNIGSAMYKKNAQYFSPKTHSKYKGAKWDRESRSYKGGLSESEVESVYEMLKKIRPVSTTDSLNYFDREDKNWALKNDMAVAMREVGIRGGYSFDLGTMYCLTGGIGVKVKLDENNYNYHVLYKTGKTDPHQEVMSGRSFASSPSRAVADATDPEYLRDLQKYLENTHDQKPFYRNLILSLANSDTSEWGKVDNLGQAVLSDFFTVYTAEAIRHLMVNLKDGVHPWEIDLAAVTAVSSLSVKTGYVVQGGKVVKDDIGAWFAPSPNNVEGGPQRSGIGITRRDRKKLQQAIHKFEMGTRDGRALIEKIQAIIGSKYNSDDVIQGVFEFLSNPYTPEKITKAPELANLFAQFVEVAREDADQIFKEVK